MISNNFPDHIETYFTYISFITRHILLWNIIDIYVKIKDKYPSILCKINNDEYIKKDYIDSHMFYIIKHKPGKLYVPKFSIIWLVEKKK